MTELLQNCCFLATPVQQKQDVIFITSFFPDACYAQFGLCLFWINTFVLNRTKVFGVKKVTRSSHKMLMCGSESWEAAIRYFHDSRVSGSKFDHSWFNYRSQNRYIETLMIPKRNCWVC